VLAIISRNATGLKQADLALQVGRERLAAALDASATGTFRWTEHGCGTRRAMAEGGVVVWVVGVVFLATLVWSALGFGEALVAVPLLALVIPVEVAAPLAVLVSITVAEVVDFQDRRHVQVRSAGRLVLASLPGIPLGLLLLTAVPDPSSRRSWRRSLSHSRRTAWRGGRQWGCGTTGWRGCSGSGPWCWAGPTA
jgi:hypothetical protein